MDNNFDDLKQLIGELVVSQKETDQIVKRTQKQLGELGNKLGSFAEGLAYPTVERIMLEEFHMDTVGPIRSRKGSETMEIDAFGYANGSINTVMVGEIKSHFREHHVEQVEQACQRLFHFMPEHRGKKVYGMVIFVKGEQNAIQLAAKHGIYTVEANDENFKLRNGKGFVPKDFGV
jgi:hypothetical protein